MLKQIMMLLTSVSGGTSGSAGVFDGHKNMCRRAYPSHEDLFRKDTIHGKNFIELLKEKCLCVKESIDVNAAVILFLLRGFCMNNSARP